MSWLDTLQRRGLDAKAKPLPSLPAKPQPKPEIKSLWLQTRAPMDARELGETEIIFYYVADGGVTLCDEVGKPAGKQHRLGPNDEPRQIAYRLGYRAWQKGRGEGDFNRRLIYSESRTV